MEADAGNQLKVFKVDGGAAANNLLMQLQADLLGTVISRPQIVETTAMGAAFLAGLGSGLWRSKAEIASVWREDRRFEPGGDRVALERTMELWRAAVAKA
jgi:glycerol kinase